MMCSLQKKTVFNILYCCDFTKSHVILYRHKMSTGSQGAILYCLQFLKAVDSCLHLCHRAQGVVVWPSPYAARAAARPVRC